MSAALDWTGSRRCAAAPTRSPGPGPSPASSSATPRRSRPTKRFTPEVLDALHGAALFRTLLPRAYNGEEVAPATFFRMQEVIAAADGSVGWCLCQASGCSFAAAYVAPEAAWEIWGDPRAVLAWGFGNGIAEVVPGGYRVSGTWGFASGNRTPPGWAGIAGSWSQTGRSARMPTARSTSAPCWFGGRRCDSTMPGTSSACAAPTVDTYTFDDIFVPEEFTVCRDSDEERRIDGAAVQVHHHQPLCLGLRRRLMGIARGMLDAFTEMAKTKTAAAMTSRCARAR